MCLADAKEALWARLFTPAAKFVICKSGIPFVAEAMEALGRPLAVQQLIALITRLDVPAYRAELIAESLWEFIDEDRSVQTRLGREYGTE